MSDKKPSHPDWPSFIPVEDECLWCRQNSLMPYDTLEKDDNLIVHYNCENKECAHMHRKGTKAYFGLVFQSSIYVKKYASFKEDKTNNDTKQKEVME